MSQRSESLDFSGLFKLDVLAHLDITAYSFYELGLKQFLALSGSDELIFIYISPQTERSDYKYQWDFNDNPIYCICFEPSGTWVLIVSDEKVLLVPFLPLFIPQNEFDHKWSLNSVTVLPLLNMINKPTTVVWWLTKESDNILIIGSKTGSITFYSLESQSIIGDTRVSDEVTDLQICFDDSLDLLTLLITGVKAQQWKLILEHRSFGYNWLQQLKATPDRDKKESFMSYIKQLSKDKITLFTQGGSKDANKSVEYNLKPTEYLPTFRKGSNNWNLTAQYVNGRHFLTAFELNEGTLILESPDQDVPSRTLRPIIKKDGQYVQSLWSQRIIYLLRKNELEVHSSAFSVVQGDGLLSSRENTLLWSAELIGTVIKAYLVSTRDPPPMAGGWKEPTFICDLQLPRFNLEQCLVVTTSGAYLVNTVCSASEWVVGGMVRGGGGCEAAAGGLGAPLPPLLTAAADLLLTRGKLAPAHYLYSLGQSQPDGWVARLGVFGRLQELSMYKQSSGAEGSLGNTAIAIKLLAILLKVANNCEEKFETNEKLQSITAVELEELCCMAAAVGLWDLVPTFSVHRGYPSILLTAIKSRSEICRGAIICLLRERSLVPLLLEENVDWLFEFIAEKCNKLDTKILKCLAVWMCPLQDQLRPVMRDLKQGIKTRYTVKMQQLIATFMRLVCVIEARLPCPEICPEIQLSTESWVQPFKPKRTVSCGLAHWAVSDEGNAKIMMADTPVNTELIGRVITVSCGRHHTLVLTENGTYASGDNSFGQLGCGGSWSRGPAGGSLLAVRAPQSFADVHAGHYHNAAIDYAGRLYTWGWGVHGQLGLGTIDDELTPQLVKKLQGRKIIKACCGACHTVVLSKCGEVFAFGAGVFGQLGTGHRYKASKPITVLLPDPVVDIAVGYFHNLALTVKGEVYVWGGSPQMVRAVSGRRAASPPRAPTAASPPHEPHLTPERVDTRNVSGKIVQISAGWHHSCIVNDAGSLYTWGLNFDGQLVLSRRRLLTLTMEQSDPEPGPDAIEEPQYDAEGSGDRKQIQIPTEIRVTRDQPGDDVAELHVGIKSNAHHRAAPPAPAAPPPSTRHPLPAAGGDRTLLLQHDGKVYCAGSMQQELTKDVSKVANRVIMMKTTKRVIKFSTNRTNNKNLCFNQVDRLDLMFPFDIEGTNRVPISPQQNPLSTVADFKRKSWPDEIVVALKPWITEDCLSGSLNVAAKYAYLTNNYSKCLQLQLENLKFATNDEKVYLAHTEIQETVPNNTPKESLKKAELKIVISTVMSKRIKEISLTILNEQPYPVIDANIYKTLPCCCDELNYLPKRLIPQSITTIKEKDMSLQAANVIDKCMGMFPVDSELWESCFRQSKNFFLENSLSTAELESVLRKYMEVNASTMASAIMYSDDCVQYNKILSPKFYLNMCSKIMDDWTPNSFYDKIAKVN